MKKKVILPAGKPNESDFKATKDALHCRKLNDSSVCTLQIMQDVKNRHEVTVSLKMDTWGQACHTIVVLQ